MKTFYELNVDQRAKAIADALWDLEESVEMGLVESNKPLSKQDMRDLAMQAAEGSMYAEDGTRIEPSFEGGCV